MTGLVDLLTSHNLNLLFLISTNIYCVPIMWQALCEGQWTQPLSSQWFTTPGGNRQ